MAFERRRRSSSGSDLSSTSTTYSNESTKNIRRFSPSRILNIDTDRALIKSNSIKRNSTVSSPAEVLLARTKNSFVDLNPFFQCSSLPSHWRKNKSLRFLLRTKPPMTVKTNTRVVLLAGNDYNPSPPMKNHISWFRDGQAEFNDLRFLGASGRGKKFTLNIIIESDPPQQCTYRRAIKITVDGPRKKRESKVKSDVRYQHGDDSNSDGESDGENRERKVSPMMMNMIESKSSAIPSGPSGLLLLAAVAEQKRLDEQSTDRQDHPMEMNSSSSCLSPTSTLVSQFTHSINFSPLFRMDPSNHHHLLTFPSSPPCLPYYHPSSQHDQQTIVENKSSTSTSSSNTRVLCR